MMNLYWQWVQLPKPVTNCLHHSLSTNCFSHLLNNLLTHLKHDYYYVLTIILLTSSVLHLQTGLIEWGTYKRHGGVVGKEVLNPDAPVWSEFEVSFAMCGLAHVAAPWINIFQLVEGSRAHQDFQAVLTETSGMDREHFKWPISIDRYY